MRLSLQLSLNDSWAQALMRTYALRLPPGVDLKARLSQVIDEVNRRLDNPIESFSARVQHALDYVEFLPYRHLKYPLIPVALAGAYTFFVAPSLGTVGMIVLAYSLLANTYLPDKKEAAKSPVCCNTIFNRLRPRASANATQQLAAFYDAIEEAIKAELNTHHLTVDKTNSV